MLPRGYTALDVNGEEAYVREDRLDQIRRIDGVVFDCDGVLVDVRGSYNRAISKTVAYILEGLTGCNFAENLISDEVIFLIRRSGGFNCDWDTVYGILMFTLAKFPQEVREKLQGLVEEVACRPDLFERFSWIREASRREFGSDALSNGFFEGLIGELKEFAGLLDATGADSVDKSLVDMYGASEAFIAFHDVLKRFLYYPPEVGESIIATAFEEIFCGLRLFQVMYRLEPKFHTGPGTIENEKLIVRPETLDRLATIIGKANLGVASGRRLEPAKYIFGNLLGRFNPSALIFLEIMDRAEQERSNERGSKVNLKKPHPFSLLRAAEAFDSFNFVLYVGDSMEDAIMVQEARKLGERFLFAGVYRYSGAEDIVLRTFLQAGCDMVIPSVNELPLVLEAARR